MDEYYKMIYIYLTQELPVQYQEYLRFVDGSILYVIPEYGNFNQYFEKISEVTTTHIQQIRERRIDLKFTVWKPTLSKDFYVYK